MAQDSAGLSEQELAALMANVRRRLHEQLSSSDSPAGHEAVESAERPASPEPAPPPAPAAPRASHPQPGAERRVAIGADHGGFALKQVLAELLVELGYEPLDLGTAGLESVDYPDFAVKVARAVARGEAWRGIMVDGAGIGSAMAANKVPGVRAATCHNEATVVNSREHNNANVLVLGSGQVNRGLARRMVRIWLATPFAGGRHAQRVAKIDALDRN
jgi:ribose 5-phosphate isomerase B